MTVQLLNVCERSRLHFSVWLYLLLQQSLTAILLFGVGEMTC